MTRRQPIHADPVPLLADLHDRADAHGRPSRRCRRVRRGSVLKGGTPGGLERWIKVAYLLIPLDESSRRRFKRAVFITMAPLLRGTGAYRRWQAAELEAQAQRSQEGSQRQLDELAHAPLQRRARRTSSPGDADGAAPLLAAPAPFGRRHGGKLVLVVHDAHAHGAQYLALNLLGELVQELGLEVRVVLLGAGPLDAAFRQLAQVQALDAGDPVAVKRLAAELQAAGFLAALANTLVAGKIVRGLSEAGIRMVTLVHEMPGIIRSHGLEQALVDVMDHSTHIVVPSQTVAEGLGQFVAPEKLAALCVELPQGLFVHGRHFGGLRRHEAAGRLRARLGLQAEAKIVLAVGYADARKGVDLFVAALIEASRRDPSVHGVWVGHHDAGQVAAAVSALESAGLSRHMHFVGLDFDTDDFYAGADVYALTSREDPFPSVLLEALSVGTPAVAFAGTGGGAALLERIGGATVPAFDVPAFADAVCALLADAAAHALQAQRGIALVEREFSFRRYAFELLSLAGIALPRVSVIVPNFNYARFLRARLASIAGQSLPVFEIIVLDDASTDGSAELLQELRVDVAPVPQLHLSAGNSGSVFRQWAKGVQAARGDFIWIAEADDLATPGLLEALVPPMQRDPDIVMAYCQSRPIDADGAITARDYSAWTDDVSAQRWRARYACSGQEEVQAALGVKNTIPNASAVVFRRDVLSRVLQDAIAEIASFTSAGDWVVYLRVLQHGRILFDPLPGNLHRRHADSVVAKQDAGAHAREVRQVQALARRLHALDDSNRVAAEQYTAHLERLVPAKAAPMKGST